ncbi:MAG: protein kinase [Deltaproteobacteria bacterium]|nr:protein kinase [Deltaproteobacteria bacterium]
MSQAYTQPEGAGELVSSTRIGPYEVLSKLAVGGMAELLLARRIGIEGFQKLVVLKRILPQYAGSPEFVEMFLAEARLAATLEHPNIVQVFDIGKSGGDYYFAMAYLHGKDLLAILRELSRRGRALPFEHAIAIGIGVAAGLHHAHEQHGFDGQPLAIVHRDVSPANAIVTFDGGVKLVDFGIAKAAAQANITRVGVRKGKAAYMSPEQCHGDVLDRRTDVWSLGVVLYEMLTMARLFRADNDLAVMHRITAVELAPPSSVVPEIPAVLDAIVMRCLQRDPATRYATADALHRDLEGCAHALGLRPSSVRLGEFVRELFGSPPPPWTQVGSASASQVVAPVTSSIELEGGTPFPASGSASDSTRDLGTSAPPQAQTAIVDRVTAPYRSTASAPQARASASGSAPSSPSRSAPTVPADSGEYPVTGTGASASTSAWPKAIATGSAVAVVIGLLTWVALRRDDAPAPTAASAPVATATPATTTAAVGVAELDGWAAALRERDPARALPWGPRHELIERLRAAGGGARIDAKQQLELDLLQVDDAPWPCAAFTTTLDTIAVTPDAYAEVLARARLPALAVGEPMPTGCGGLAARLDMLRRAAGVGTPPDVTATPSADTDPTAAPRNAAAMPPGEPTPRPQPRAKPAPKSKPDADAKPSAHRSDDAGPRDAKLDDELRPFRK